MKKQYAPEEANLQAIIALGKRLHKQPLSPRQSWLIFYAIMLVAGLAFGFIANLSHLVIYCPDFLAKIIK